MLDAPREDKKKKKWEDSFVVLWYGSGCHNRPRCFSDDDDVVDTVLLHSFVGGKIFLVSINEMNHGYSHKRDLKRRV